MSRASKRPYDYDEDPDDDDFDIRGVAPSPRKRVKKITSGLKSRPKPPRRRGRYAGSDIEEDEDDLEEDDIEDSDVDEPSSPIVINEATGRSSRKIARQRKTYTEPDTDDDIPVPSKEESDLCTPPPASRGKRPQRRSEPRSLIVTLAVNFDKLEQRKIMSRQVVPSRNTRSRDPESAAPSAPATRRSSRITHSEERLVSLTDSGRHEREEGAAVASASERPASRRTVGRKGPPRTTSTIIEASQEDDEDPSSRVDLEDQISDITPEDEVEGILIAEPSARYPSAMLDDDAKVAQDELQQTDAEGDVDVSDAGQRVIAESVQADDDDEDDEPVLSRAERRLLRSSGDAQVGAPPKDRPRRGRPASRRRAGPDDGSDFEPAADEPEDDKISSDDERPLVDTQDSETSGAGRRSRRIRSQRTTRGTLAEITDEDDELADEVADLTAASRRNRKRKRSPDEIAYDRPARRRARDTQQSYYVGPDMWPIGDDDDQPVTTMTRTGRGAKSAGAYRSLWDTKGPFGVTGGPPNIRSGPTASGADSDSSDDDVAQRARPGIGGVAGMTPTSAGLPFGFPTSHEREPTSGPANLGRVKDAKARADADPLGVDQSVNFDGVGGLESHVNQLKEMVLLPLLYPELFSRLHVTPPRGVLFHGPPGTGKTLLARALSNSVTSGGKRVTFYMRKGADTLSKYVGEAERQLRLLFEDARKNQPSIIFFDEIDGLAPVRSSKQDQIHATIVTTLLALMDGMDGRGQVIVIGATNRPDTVDSALRRPGRFDREFYFPLPDVAARRKIIDIHTKGWEPPLEPPFKDQLASLTNGYGGADLRALCTEAALNAIQGTYPQIYTSMEKLLVDPKAIKILAKDFMLSVDKIVPSSQRSTSSNATPLDERVEPLLKDAFQNISQKLDKMLPQRKKLTALEEAMYDDRDDKAGFNKELMQQNFDQARIFRPRMLVYGKHGMGQHFIGSALLHKFERLHVQNFDLSVLYGDSARSPQAAVVQLFTEARRHKPSVIYIPNLDLWYKSLEPGVIELFKTSLNALPPNEPVLLLATMDLSSDTDAPAKEILRDLFGFSKHTHHHLERPNEKQRHDFFAKVFDLIKMSPDGFPDPAQRKKRDLPQLAKAPALEAPQRSLTKEQLKDMKRHDIAVLNKMKIRINPIMEQLKREYKGFRRPAVEPDMISYLFDATDPAKIASDVPVEEQDMADRPYAVAKDAAGVDVLREVATNNIYYNIELVTVEKRLSNGYYKRPKDFLADIRRINKDAKTLGDQDKILKSNLMLTNVSVDIEYLFDESDPQLTAECERVYERERERERLVLEKAALAQAAGQDVPVVRPNIPPQVSMTTTATTGPVMIGQPVNGRPPVPQGPLDQFRHTSLSNGLSNGVGPSGPSSNGHHDLSHDSDNDIVGNSQDDGAVQQATSQPFSQRNAMTPMAQGSQASQYQNSASTTTSGNKTSSKSKSSSNNTQGSNGIPLEEPNLGLTVSGASQLPDTQEYPSALNPSQEGPPFTQQQSQRQGLSQASPPNPLTQNSQEMPPPPVRRSTDASFSPHPQLILNKETVDKTLGSIVEKSSGFSVEQLEQMNATLMDTLWQHRGNWNRDRVLELCAREFNTLCREMVELQDILSPSQHLNDEFTPGSLGR